MKFILLFLIVVVISSNSFGSEHTSNWLKFLNSDAQYLDPCDGYRNNVKPHFEKSVVITNKVDPISINKIVHTYILADMKYRQDEDNYMKSKYPEWWEVANNNKNTRYYNTNNFNYTKYSVGKVGYPRLMNLGQRAVRSLLLDKPQGGYLTLTLYLREDIRNSLWLHNHVGFDYNQATKLSYNENSRVAHHWEADPRNTWLTTETPRTYYRCPMEHPLWNTPKWEVMMNCVINGICSAQIQTHIR